MSVFTLAVKLLNMIKYWIEMNITDYWVEVNWITEFILGLNWEVNYISLELHQQEISYYVDQWLIVVREVVCGLLVIERHIYSGYTLILHTHTHMILRDRKGQWVAARETDRHT